MTKSNISSITDIPISNVFIFQVNMVVSILGKNGGVLALTKMRYAA